MRSFQRCAFVVAAVVGIVSFQMEARGQRSAGAIVAIDEAVGASVGTSVKSAGGSAQQTKSGSSSRTSGKAAGGSAGTKATTHTSSSTTTGTTKRTVVAEKTVFSGPVLGDKYTFLNFEVISAAKPTHTLVAKKAGADGLVQVEVLVSENGNVLSAHARTGNKLLWDEAERAALASKFNKPTANGQPARALGFLVYRFGPATEEDDNN